MDDGMMSSGVPSIDAYGPEGKRKINEMDVDVPRGKARTLGGDRVRDVSQEQATEIVGRDGIGQVWSAPRTRTADVLNVPRIMTQLSVRVEGSEDILEGNNFEDARE